MLQFTVIAGPNGAGKSTYSTRMSHPDTLIFDPDFHKQSIEQKYPDIAEDALMEAVTSGYHIIEAKALAGKKSLTVETNLRNEFLADRAAFFKANGYQTRFVFMLLPNVDSSMDRVNLRVKQKGHFVSAANIRANFEDSLRMLPKVAVKFDQVMLISAVSDQGVSSLPELLLTIKSGVVIRRNDSIPEWAMPTVADIISLTTNQNLDSPDEYKRSGPKR
ncbi:zeta toxin family protein [Mucilaginibacter lacusdianchii]|uniref:zeta toxin family protein n=1 Tax=Mucilaginibacter lacusdianchii TaxID=2684211 RepID=UPI00131C2CD8|nr:AAA family ATPase [Mucilaginibacter sp. JXJ CY 39]